MIDSSNYRYQNGSDVYISRIVKDLLSPEEITSVAQAHRNMRDGFVKDEAIKAINDRISKESTIIDGKVSISVDLGTKNAWENSLVTQVDEIPFGYIGKGAQCVVKTELALTHKRAQDASIILLEEPESHLSYSKLNQLIAAIEGKYSDKQISISTHNSFVANKLDLNNIVADKVLITTFTNANEYEIRAKFIKLNGSIPENVTVQTWFSFLLQHGVKPYQDVLMAANVMGLLLVNNKSGFRFNSKQGFPVYFSEADVKHYYFSSGMKIYSDKIAKFAYVVNEKTKGLIIDRISRIYPHIYIDEVQDLAGYDLELVHLLLQTPSNIIMVGDPRQVTYHTHEEAKNNKYTEGQTEQFICDK